MHKFVEDMEPKNYRLIRHAAAQLAGRKPRKYHYNYKIPRDKQHRARQSPYKDIADATQQQMANFMKQDGLKRQMGGGLFSAFEDVVGLIHNEVTTKSNEFKNSIDQGAADFAQKYNAFEKEIGLTPLKNTLGNLAGTAGVQADIEADDFLNRVGIRHKRKYTSSEVDTNLQDHARLQKDAYQKLGNRKGTNRFEYLKENSTDKYGVYLDRHNAGKVIMAFRGTDPKEAIHNNDFIEDINIAAGNVNAISEFDDYRNKLSALLDEYGDGNVSLSGYSLGGAKAVALTREPDFRSRLGTTMALSPGMTATDPSLANKAHDNKIQYYYKHTDPVANALLGHGGSNHHVFYDEKNPLQAHMVLDNWAK